MRTLLIDARRKDLRALARAGRSSLRGWRIVRRRQVEMVGEALGECRGVMKAMSLAGPRESLKRLPPLARAAILLALIDIRELARLAASSQAEALGIVRQRIEENLGISRTD